MSFDGHPSFSSPRLPLSMRFALCVILSLGLLIADKNFQLSAHIKKISAYPLLPINWLSNQPLKLIYSISDSVKTNIQLQKENNVLREKNLEQSAILSNFRTVEREFNELKQLTGMTSYNLRVIGVAETLNIGNDPFIYRLNISGAQIKNFKVGQSVIDKNGLLGIITSVQPFNAEVTLAVNKGFMVPIMLERTGERSILYGYGGGVGLPYFPNSSDIRVGDKLVTSGLDGVYPTGIPVATIKSVNKNHDTQFAKVICTAIAGMRSARYIIVVDEAKATITTNTRLSKTNNKYKNSLLDLKNIGPHSRNSQ